MQIGVLEYLITINNKGATKAINDTEKTVKDSSNKISAWMIAKGQLIARTAEKAIKLVGGTVKSVVKGAVDSFAEFEQLEGGVKKLFGEDVQRTVINNAMKAYKTAGLSANQYMQTVTEFSASLISGLAGDTKRAADVSDMAIQDMADNANTFGSTMEAIQNAYRGFSKQNYTMLDNLKLGYGGTRTEMERLLKDAEKLANKKFSIGNLADVYEAIHVIQQNLNITGTTKNEAEGTIQGSIATAKSAWQNFLTAMGRGKGVKEATKQLGESVKQVVKNVIPVVKEAFKNLLSSLKDVIPDLASLIGDVWVSLKESFPKDSFIYQAMTAVQGLISLLGDLIVDWDGTIAKLKASDSPVLQKLGFALTIVGSIADYVKKLFTDFPGVVQELKNSDTPVLQLIGQALEWIQSLFTWISEHQEETVRAIEAILAAFAIGKIISIITSLSPITLILAGIAAAATLIINNWDGIQKFFEDLWAGVQDAAEHCWELLTEFWSDVSTRVSGAWESVKSFFINLWNLVKDAAVSAWEAVTQWWTDVGGMISSAWDSVLSFLTNLWDTVKTAVVNAWNAVTQWWTGILSSVETAWNGVQSFFEGIWSGISTAVTNAWNTVSQWWTGIIDKVETAWSTIADWFNTEVWTPISTFFAGLWETVGKLWGNIKSEVIRAWAGVSGWLKTNVWDKISDFFGSMWSGIQAFWANPLGSVINAWSAVSGWIKKNVTDPVIGFFKDVESTIRNAINSLLELLGLQSGEDPGVVYGTDAPIKNIGGLITNNNNPSGGAPASKPMVNAKGNWNVPYDNFPALLHRNEMVLNKSQARRYRDGESMDYATIGSMIGSSIENAMNRVYIMMSGEKVGDLTTRRVKRNINADSYSKIRAMGG